MSSNFPVFTQTFHSSVYPAIDPTNDKLSASGKVVVVTGGSRGIGRAIGLAFATAGARAIIPLGRTSSTLRHVSEDILAAATANGHETVVKAFTVDVSDASAVAKTFESIQKEFDHIDVLVSNAGDLYKSTIGDCDTSAFENTFKINVNGTLNCMHALVHFGRGNDPQRATTFINLTTIGIAMPGFPGWAAYAGSKLAAFRMVECFKAEVGDQVRVFSINPGHVATDMSKKAGVPCSDDAGKCSELQSEAGAFDL